VEDLALSGDLRAFWRKRRVFLTGHTGFKGSWLSTFLQVLGAETTGYALAPEGSPCLFDDARVATNMRSVIGAFRQKTGWQPQVTLTEGVSCTLAALAEG